MKKKLFIAAIVMIAGVAVSLEGSGSFENLSVSELVNLNKAQASCVTNTYYLGGRCSAMFNCYANPDPGEQNCAWPTPGGW